MPGSVKSALSPEQFYQGILSGERSILAQAITQAESTLESDRRATEELIKRLLPRTGQSIRIGITGVPGAGKSTFIEKFGEWVTREGKKVGVLTIDPSSEKTKGSILGDKTRMEQLSKNPKVFIRPSPSSLALGGVSHHTRESVLLCEAAGYDVILIETVGVGQSETYVHSMVDFFLLMVLAGAGDELQGIKKGIIEMADAIVVAKSDGDNVKPSLQAKADILNALHIQAASSSGWKPAVLTVSALENKGVAEVWKLIQNYQEFTTANGFFDKNRSAQKSKWFEENIESQFRAFMRSATFQTKKEKWMAEVMKDAMMPSEAARKLWESFLLR